MAICQRCLRPVCHHYGLHFSNAPCSWEAEEPKVGFFSLLGRSLTGSRRRFLFESRCDWSRPFIPKFFLVHPLHTVEHGCALLGCFFLAVSYMFAAHML